MIRIKVIPRTALLRLNSRSGPSRLTALVIPGLVVYTALGLAPMAEPAEPRLEVLGTAVIPHVPASGMRFRREVDFRGGARVQVFVRHRGAGDGSSGSGGSEAAYDVDSLRVDGSSPAEHLAGQHWSWHDTPGLWKAADRRIPLGALVCWTWNQVNRFEDGASTIVVAHQTSESDEELKVELRRPRVWLASVTFLAPEKSLFPDRVLVHVRNESDRPVHVRSLRLWLPESNGTYRYLFPKREVTKLELHPADGALKPRDTGCVIARVEPLPLTYTAIELRLEDAEKRPLSLWSHLRIKKEVFDIGGGWVSSNKVPGGSLKAEPYLKTLKGLHISSGMHGPVSGYTDQTGPDGLYTRYPIKMMNRMEPVQRFDREEFLPRIHAVEFLGEPQYRARSRGSLPPAVLEAFRPYAPSRLATSVTLSDASTWHLWAGLSDYPHYDAYRVTAPMADSWRRYTRWGGMKIGWGAPLETIGDMTRSLRENSRPAPIAYWSQGPHAGWRGYDGRKRASPTRDEIRLQAYHALSSRITSLYWFNLSLRSLVKYRDTLEELQRIGREIRLLEEYYLEGCAYSYRQVMLDNKPHAALAVIAAPRGALLFALDLDYRPDSVDKVFRFRSARDVEFDFTLPAYLRRVEDVFRVDAGGVHECEYDIKGDGVRVRDRFTKVGVWIAALNRGERARLKSRHADLVSLERAFGFDPARRNTDFETLSRLLRK